MLIFIVWFERNCKFIYFLNCVYFVDKERYNVILSCFFLGLVNNYIVNCK